MRSTFSILFYINRGKIKADGTARESLPLVAGRTIGKGGENT